jgi:hypothetical protein
MNKFIKDFIKFAGLIIILNTILVLDIYYMFMG